MTRPGRRRTLCAGLVFGLVLGWPTLPWAQPPAQNRLPEFTYLDVGTTRLRVPLIYNAIMSRGEFLLFSAMLEGYGPYTRTTATGWPMSELYETVRISMHYDARREANRWVAGYLDVLRRNRVEPSFPSDRLSGTDEPVPAGLRMQQTEPEDPQRGRLASDWFDVEPLLNGGPEAIVCSSPFSLNIRNNITSRTNLRCEHLFVHRGARMSLGYERQHLVRWREIRDSSIALIERFAFDGLGADGL